MGCFVIGLVLILIFPNFIPIELWIGLSLIEGVIELFLALALALVS